MKIFVALCLALFLGLAFYFFSDKDPLETPISSQNSPLSCDLNVKICEVNFKGKTLKFQMQPKPIFAMTPVNFEIFGLGEFDFKNPSLEFYGLNMDMGKIKAKLSKNGEKYSSKIVLSACVIDVMRYRFEILENGEKTGIFIDFDLKI